MYFAIKSLLNKTESCIKINEILSNIFQVRNSVRQSEYTFNTGANKFSYTIKICHEF